MSLESCLRQVLADYRVHVRKWRRCFRNEFPDLPADFGIEDVSDDDIEQYDELRDDQTYEAERLLKILMFRIEIELALPDKDPAEPTNHNE